MKAAAVVRDLCAGVYTKKNKSRAAPGTTSDACTQPVRKRKLSSSDTTATTSATKPAGPGRGHKGPKWDDAVTAAERVLQKSNASNEELRYALKRTVKECKSLQQMCDAVSLEGCEGSTAAQLHMYECVLTPSCDSTGDCSTK